MTDELYAAILKLKTPDEVARFLRDLLTLPEIREFSKRFQIAKALYLKQGSYQTIASKLHVSTTTVTRVAHWLHHGKGGYKLVLDNTYKLSRQKAALQFFANPPEKYRIKLSKPAHILIREERD